MYVGRISRLVYGVDLEFGDDAWRGGSSRLTRLNHGGGCAGSLSVKRFDVVLEEPVD